MVDAGGRTGSGATGSAATGGTRDDPDGQGQHRQAARAGLVSRHR
ncbi:hypothetical protein [Verrucosispora sioxanthis]|nr:hypothetical protein [Verrucosispora sioxanthis]